MSDTLGGRILLRVSGVGADGVLRVRGRSGRMTGMLDGRAVRYRPLPVTGWARRRVRGCEASVAPAPSAPAVAAEPAAGAEVAAGAAAIATGVAETDEAPGASIRGAARALWESRQAHTTSPTANAQTPMTSSALMAQSPPPRPRPSRPRDIVTAKTTAKATRMTPM